MKGNDYVHERLDELLVTYVCPTLLILFFRCAEVSSISRMIIKQRDRERD